MKILVTGASGFIGSSLLHYLRACGHQPVPLVRSAQQSGAPTWEPEKGRIDLKPAGEIQAAIHLAGEPITGRWTEARKKKIQASRAEGTRLLCDTLVGMPSPPSVLISGSAVGFYGDRGSEIMEDFSPPGSGFLADVTQAWESATIPAHAKGIRVVQLRMGIVLSPEGGALKKMLLLFRLGLGGRIGSGEQFWSWIALDDLQSAILYALTQPTLSGPINAVSPQPVTNSQFTKTLGKVLFRPAVLPVPEGIIRRVFGEMADATLLASTRVQPTQLIEDGFTFQFPELESALRHLLRR